MAGALGGRRLSAPPGRATRPTSDRVRESLFAVLGPLDGLRVLDLFAGSGALGIEALSRGAEAAVFVDHDPRAVAVVRENLDRLGLEAPVHRADGLEFLLRPVDDPFDLVLLDPPYSCAGRLGPVLSERLPAVLAPRARIVTESDPHNPLPIALALEDERRYGSTRIAIHRGP